MLKKLKKNIFKPYFVMLVVVLMYLLKVISKIFVGWYTNSPMILGDGFHNLSDLVEALFVIFSIYLLQLSEKENEEFKSGGLRNSVVFVQLTVGVSLFVVFVSVLYRSFCGIIDLAILIYGHGFGIVIDNLSKNQGTVIGINQNNFLLALSLMVISVVLSFIVGKYEIYSGKLNKQMAMESDGQETICDGYIELAELFGVLGRYVFGFPEIEYFFCLYIAHKLIGVSLENLTNAVNIILQRRISKDLEDGIIEIVKSLPGVVGTPDIVTFRVGHIFRYDLKVFSNRSTRANTDMKMAIVDKVKSYLKENGFDYESYWIRITSFDEDHPMFSRVVYAVVCDNLGDRVAIHFDEATHVRLCDLDHGVVVHWSDLAIPNSDTSSNWLISFLVRHGIKTYRSFDEGSNLVDRLNDSDIEYIQTPTLDVYSLGIGKKHLCQCNCHPQMGGFLTSHAMRDIIKSIKSSLGLFFNQIWK